MARIKFISSFFTHRELWWRLTEREILSRYKGSILGGAWSLITPLMMLGVYSFVFSQIFQSRWGGLEETGPLGFAVNLFAGLIVYNIFAECVSRAPNIITTNPNYVKKVIFPLEVLGTSATGSALFNGMTSFIILIIFQIMAFGALPKTILLLPLIWIPLILGTLAATWILSAAGVFIRDIGQVIGVALQMLMFLSPIFFPITALPANLRPLLQLNPIAIIIEQTRSVVIKGEIPDANYILTGTIISLLACELSFRAFIKSKKAFADVI